MANNKVNNKANILHHSSLRRTKPSHRINPALAHMPHHHLSLRTVIRAMVPLSKAVSSTAK
jgi:hypothetical protein